MKHFIIREDLRNGLLQYLATKPLQEAMNAFIALKELPEFPSEKVDNIENNETETKNI